MVTKFTRRETTTHSDGTQDDYNESVEITNVSPGRAWSADVFVLTVPVPDGTHVTALDDQPIEYLWRGGRPVKVVNSTSIESAGSHAFVPPTSQRRWWPWAAVAVGVVIVIGVITWRPWRARR